MYGIEGMITFTYHEDLEEASRFYGEALGLERVMDRDWVKIYRVGSGGHIGLVDSKRGYLQPSKDKPVMLSIMVSDVDAWYRRLTERGREGQQSAQAVGGHTHEWVPHVGPLRLRRGATRVPHQALRRVMEH